MPKATVVNMTGAKVGEVELSDAIFGIEPNVAVVHEVVKNHLANCRQGTQSALTRAEVSGGGKSPGDRKVPAMPARAAPVRPSGPTAVSSSPPSPEITATASTAS